jgi:cytochrome c556
VKGTQEAILDFSFLVKTSTTNIRDVRALQFGTGPFDVEDFVTRLITFMGGHKPPADVSPEDSDIEEDDSPLDWGKVGRRTLAKSRRVPAMGFMCVPHPS